MNDPNLIKLYEILRGTLDVDATVRRSAESALFEASKSPGFALLLMKLITIEEKPGQIALSAAVSLKNFVMKNWYSERGEVDVSDEDRINLRSYLITCIFDVPPIIHAQLTEIVGLICKCDSIASWPELLVLFEQIVTVKNECNLCRALSTMNVIFGRYRHESQSAKLFEDIVSVVNKLSTPLSVLFKELSNYICSENADQLKEKAEEILQLLYLIVDIFYSLISQELPDVFMYTLEDWMKGLHNLIKLKLPTLEAIYNDSDDGELETLYKLKCCVCDVYCLFSQKYEEEFLTYAASVMESVWKQVIELSAKPRFDAFYQSALAFLLAFSIKLQYSHLIKIEGVLSSVVENIVMKNLRLTAYDLYLFGQDPLEFVKKHLEGSDSGSRRCVTIDFLRSLYRVYESILTPALADCINNFIKNGSLSDIAEGWQKKDVIYCIILAVGAKTETVSYGATSLSNFVDITSFYVSDVRGDLFAEKSNIVPYLQCDALRYIVTFRNHLPPQELIQSLQAILMALSSSYSVVHHFAANALERILLVKSKESGKTLFSEENTPVGELLSALLKCFAAFPESQNSHYLMKAFMRCINIIDAATLQHASEIVVRIAEMVGAAVKVHVDSLHIHYLFESLSILIRKAHVVIGSRIEECVVPLIKSVLENESCDFLPYALQVTAVLIDVAFECKKGESAFFQSFDYVMKEHIWNGSANIPAALLVIESLLRCDAKGFLTRYSDTIVAIYQRLIESKALDHYGFLLATSLVACKSIDMNTQITSSSLLIPILRRIQCSKTSKFIRGLLLFIAEYAINCGGANLYQALESIQAGIFKLLVEKIVLLELAEVGLALGDADKRLCCIGLIKLTSEAIDYMSDYYGDMVEKLVRISETYGSNAAVVADDNDEIEMIEISSDRFSKLVYAQHRRVPASAVEDFKAFLASIVASVGVSKPGSMECIRSEVRDILARYSINNSN